MENLDDEAIERQSRLAETRQRDFDDLQNEIAGNDTGRLERFLTAEGRGGYAAEKRKQERADTLTRLQMMMRDPAYARIYNDTTTRLREVQTELDRMADEVQRLANETRESITLIDARAARDSEGRAVFKDATGTAHYADRTVVSEDEAAGIVWRGDEPTLEEREAQVERLARLDGLTIDIAAGQAEIGGMQNDLQDDDDPKTTDEMDGMTTRADEIGASLRERFEAERDRTFATPEISVGLGVVPTTDIPKLSLR